MCHASRTNPDSVLQRLRIASASRNTRLRSRSSCWRLARSAFSASSTKASLDTDDKAVELGIAYVLGIDRNRRSILSSMFEPLRPAHILALRFEREANGPGFALVDGRVQFADGVADQLHLRGFKLRLEMLTQRVGIDADIFCDAFMQESRSGERCDFGALRVGWLECLTPDLL